jgi:hypothetical protein
VFYHFASWKYRIHNLRAWLQHAATFYISINGKWYHFNKCRNMCEDKSCKVLIHESITTEHIKRDIVKLLEEISTLHAIISSLQSEGIQIHAFKNLK